MNQRILVIDDEPDFLDTLKRGLIVSGFRALKTINESKAAADLILQGEIFDIALIDINMPGINGIGLLEIIKENSPDTECIMISALNEAKLAVNCMKKGAYTYLLKPIQKEELILTINRALERKRFLDLLTVQKSHQVKAQTLNPAFSAITTRSPSFYKVLKEAELHSASDVPVLITGESGTGKELLARSIHMASQRSRFKYLAINMASMSHSLFDSEFFGHTRGAFTGAKDNRKGYLETTHKGTLFLDEIGHLPLELQGKLLRFLQEGEYLKLGTNTPKTSDIRIIAATNADLDQLIAKGQFRKDLYYRLKGAWLNIPPLRKRKEDIYLLINHFLSGFDKKDTKVDDRALSLLTAYDYPGNIRELKSIVQAALNLSKGKKILSSHLPGDIRKKTAKRTQIEKMPVQTLSRVEQQHITDVYAQTGKNKSQSARLLGIGLNTLRRKLKSYGMN